MAYFLTHHRVIFPLQKKRDWKPLEQRSCTDIPWLLLFILFNVGMVRDCTWVLEKTFEQTLPLKISSRWPALPLKKHSQWCNACHGHHLVFAALHMWLRHSIRGRLQTHIRVRQLWQHLWSEECWNPRNRTQRQRPDLKKVRTTQSHAEITVDLTPPVRSAMRWFLVNASCFWLCRYVFFLDPCNIDLLRRKIKSVALCVSKCPKTELNTYEDLTHFSANNGELYGVLE